MPESDEWEALRHELDRAGVVGADELGRFVSNVEFFGASAFDERAAMPVLLAALPRLTDPRLVSAVAGHLRRPWARPQAFDPLLAAFQIWAQSDATAAWQLGDSLGSAATMDRLPDLVGLCVNRAYGTARQMPVLALARFKKSPDVRPVLLELIHDGDLVFTPCPRCVASSERPMRSRTSKRSSACTRAVNSAAKPLERPGNSGRR